MHTYIYTYIYIYIERERVSSRNSIIIISSSSSSSSSFHSRQHQTRAKEPVARKLLSSPTLIYGQTANEDPRKSEFESQRILNVEGGLS